MKSQNAPLKRKADLGIQSIPLNDSIQALLGYSGKGLLLSTIKNGGSAAHSGIKKDDILISIANKSITSAADLKELTNTFRSGDQASAQIWRNGKPKTIQIHFTGMPFEKSDNYEIIYDEYVYDEGRIRSIIYKPFGKGPFPTVFFIQGFGCYSVEMPKYHPYTQLFDALVQSGVTVVKTEKPAMGDSEGYCDCTQNDLHYEIGAHKAGLHSLSNYHFIDTTQVFFWGHSLGGVIAPVLAQDYKPAGIAVYGTVVRPWQEFLPQMIRFQMPFFGMDYAQTDTLARKSTEILFHLLGERKSPVEILDIKPELRPYFEKGFMYDGKDMLWGKHWKYLAQIDDFNLPLLWSQLNVPVLVMHGEFDFESCLEFEPKRLAEIVNKSPAGEARYIKFKGTTHSFVKAKSYEDGLANRNMEYFKDNFNQEIPDETVAWIRSIINSK